MPWKNGRTEISGRRYWPFSSQVDSRMRRRRPFTTVPAMIARRGGRTVWPSLDSSNWLFTSRQIRRKWLGGGDGAHPDRPVEADPARAPDPGTPRAADPGAHADAGREAARD